MKLTVQRHRLITRRLRPNHRMTKRILYLHTLLLLLVTQSCPTPCGPMYCGLPGSSVHGISQARVLVWIAIPFSSDLPNPGVKLSPAWAGRFFTTKPPGKPPIPYYHIQFSSVTQSCPTLCDPMNCSMPGLPVHHHLPEFTQTHVHRVSDATQSSHPLLSPFPPAPNPSQHQGLFQ